MVDRRLFIPLFAAAWLLAACSGSATALPESPFPTEMKEPTSVPVPTETPVPTPAALVVARDGRVFTYYGADPQTPIVPRGPVERWDGLYINPGGMLVHDGLFHMFHNGFKNWPGLVSVGYMTSPDGLVWTEVQAEPVFTSGQVSYVEDGEGADISSAIVMDDGIWVLYFHRVSNNSPGDTRRPAAGTRWVTPRI